MGGASPMLLPAKLVFAFLVRAYSWGPAELVFEIGIGFAEKLQWCQSAHSNIFTRLCGQSLFFCLKGNQSTHSFVANRFDLLFTCYSRCAYN